MEKFRSGNVVRLANGSNESNGSLVIIVNYRTVELSHPPSKYKVCDYVYVNFDHMSGCSRLETITEEELCNCDIANGRVDDDCDDCEGTGKYMKTTWGMDEAVLVASTVKSWIINTITNKFNF